MSAPDRARAPEPREQPAFRAPAIEIETFANGAKLVRTHTGALGFGIVSVALSAGFWWTPRGRAGLPSLALELLREGTDRLDGTALQNELDGLGATLSLRAGGDELVIELTALTRHLEMAVRLFFEVLQRPRFAEGDVERQKRQRKAELEAQAADSARIAQDAWRAVIYGDDAPGLPPRGTLATVASFSAQELAAYWRAALDPRRLRVALVSPPEPGHVRVLRESLAALSPPASALPLRPSLAFAAGTERRITLVDRPGAPQTLLYAGHLGVAASDPDFYPLVALNHPLGGTFSSRINLNLREDKGWTYGAHSAFHGGLFPGPFQVQAAVQTDATADAAREIALEIERLREGGPSAEEVEFARRALSQELLVKYEPAEAKVALAANIGKYGWPVDYPARRLEWLARMSAAELRELGRRRLHPESLEILAVGDAKRIRASLEALDLGPVRLRPA